MLFFNICILLLLFYSNFNFECCSFEYLMSYRHTSDFIKLKFSMALVRLGFIFYAVLHASSSYSYSVFALISDRGTEGENEGKQ